MTIIIDIASYILYVGKVPHHLKEMVRLYRDYRVVRRVLVELMEPVNTSYIVRDGNTCVRVDFREALAWMEDALSTCFVQ